jgi:uncharacterized protein YutD
MTKSSSFQNVSFKAGFVLGALSHRLQFIADTEHNKVLKHEMAKVLHQIEFDIGEISNEQTRLAVLSQVARASQESLNKLLDAGYVDSNGYDCLYTVLDCLSSLREKGEKRSIASRLFNLFTGPGVTPE